MGGTISSAVSFVDYTTSSAHELIKLRLSEGKQNVRVTEDLPDESGVYHARESADLSYEQLMDGVKVPNLTLQMRERCSGPLKNKTCVLYRPIIRFETAQVADEKTGRLRPWQYAHLDATREISHGAFWDSCVRFGRGLRALGIPQGAMVTIYEETRWEWLATAFGLWTQRMIGVTVYANLGKEAFKAALQETETRYVVCSVNSIEFLRGCFSEIGATNVILISLCSTLEDIYKELPESTEALRVVRFEEVLDLGRANEAEFPEDPAEDPDALALIMYTSGTTGNPKGVMFTHSNISSAVATSKVRYRSFLEENAGYVYLCYLPLAHIFEFLVENVMFFIGVVLAYGTTRTLMSTGAKPRGDIEEYRPHCMSAVPRVLETIKKGVEAKLPPAGSVQRALFDKAFSDRSKAYARGYETPAWDKLLFRSLREKLGGRMISFITGGAPCSPETDRFVSVAFGCGNSLGYGLTETCACVSVQSLWDLSTENVGMLMPGVELKLRDTDDFRHTDTNVGGPRGEILIRAASVAIGYYKQPQLTKESFLPGGWFATGDIGQIDDKTGCLRIIGRIKALCKNANGEYIALETLESIYGMHDLSVPNGVCILVHPYRGYIAALTVTDKPRALAFAKAVGIAEGPGVTSSGEFAWPDILENPAFQQAANKSLAAFAKSKGCKPFECIRHSHVLGEPWTPENGLLTAAMKIKRSVVDERFKDIIDDLFKEER